jgi:hypothetical protein
VGGGALLPVFLQDPRLIEPLPPPPGIPAAEASAGVSDLAFYALTYK